MVSPPIFLRLAHPGVTWQMSRKEKVLYLTFDDGPDQILTNKVLDLLKSTMPATFFASVKTSANTPNSISAS
ncbi:MAG: polysaccharide deacetylase family protein [Bacteroidetes bacterium]|nr:polysaccharide deacetylase family protein [Bacteroidota bacterium]